MARMAIHPGETLAEILDGYHLSAAEAGRHIGVPTNRITQIIAGRRGITADTALRLGRWLKMSPQFWINLQTQYELRLAEELAGEEIERTVVPRAGIPDDAAA